MPDPSRDMPSWLGTSEQYRPGSDRDGFVMRSLLSVSSALALLRLDDGRETAVSPSPAIKLAFGLVCVLLVSLSRNFLFVLVVLAGLLMRCCLLPRNVLGRVMTGSAGAAALTLLVTLPAALMGQTQSALTLAAKTFACVGITLTVALTTPAASLTRALRRLGLPGVAILTVDLALRRIVRLGETAAEVLCALNLRSVGRNRSKGMTMGGVGGVVLVKAGRAAQDTYDAMRCRGFDGEYTVGEDAPRTAANLCWLAVLGLLAILFCYLQGMV